MELLLGGTLEALLKSIRDKNVQFSDYESSLIIKQIAQGLNYMHKQNLIHRDIKPG